MKYIAIIGSNYKDCKSKLDSIEKQPETKYVLVTKPKHLNGIPFSEVILADVAKNNPSFPEMVKKVRKIIVSGPQVEKKIKKIVEKPVEDVKEEPTEIKLGEELGFDPQPKFEEELNNELPPEEPAVDEPVEVEEEPAPMIDELPEEESTVDESLDSINVDGVPSIDDVSDPYDMTVHSEITPEPIDLGHDFEFGEEPEVEDEPIEEEDVIPETASEEEEAEIKPVNPPRGWHLRNEFIDEVGNIFHKGQYVGSQTDE